MKILLVLLFSITINFANEISDNKNYLLSDIKSFEKEIKPYVQKDFIDSLNDLKKEVSNEKNQMKLDLLTLFYLDLKFQIKNN